MFRIKYPSGKKVPIIVSCPHSGTEIPADIAQRMNPVLSQDLPDTDWYIDKLYDFSSDLGITQISAVYSRYVVDLNRDPSGVGLYKDGRTETGLVPVKSFNGDALYKPGEEPSQKDIEERLQHYYQPYHRALTECISGLLSQFPQVLLFDAHSIKRHVPLIHKDPFPDLILGDQSGKTADKSLSESALTVLRAGKTYQVAYNHPFMGGYITRHFGNPKRGVHTLQLEKSQDIYMDQDTKQIAAVKWSRLRVELVAMFEGLISATSKL